MQLRTKVIGAAGIAAVVAAGGFAFTAGSALPSTATGYGNVTVSDLTVEGVVWNLDATKTTAQSIDFTVTSPGIVDPDLAFMTITENQETTPVVLGPDACHEFTPGTNVLNCVIDGTNGVGLNLIKTVELSYAGTTS